MEDKAILTPIKDRLDSAKSIIIILPPDPSKDLVDAGVSLHFALKQSGKESQIGCGSEVHASSDSEGFSEITDSIGSRNLVISFDYQEEDLDKVDYDVRDDGKFYLMVKPKTGSPVPDISNVRFSYSGATADLVITLGANSLEELGKIYADEKNFLDQADILSLNITLNPASFTNKLFHQSTDSFSELITSFIEKTGLKITNHIAQNLLKNIYESTGHLSNPHLKADTFASIAFLMRAGAELPTTKPQMPHFAQPPFFEVPETSSTNLDEENIPLPEEENQTVPSDWNKPKIFRVKQ